MPRRKYPSYLERGDIELAQREFLGPSGDPFSSAYGDILAEGTAPYMAADFQKFMEELLSP